ncbi:ABC transporter permease subunit [Rhodoblastus acidophilus]|uniref:ABC transporter permease subunit n=1 Tax=Candidatus Rhodoblastus alkanivorans TaxID=2954117 RepID=A0ABS9Z7Q2_9HYPH|nr:ABC transporter permease subunit [Candidatus Rhodoblastus alkanivorans]MCI4679895.1 ABC transporter permease subunit [Candidatus Rhodoblastus alkanivorans]MCI4682702.1 ABC transporter permease subunit [Candidatus Rhodoblastus alkanivorans]MDI4640009.1 ABC transporter permease subunit [Rhodoblastus acidophilus]
MTRLISIFLFMALWQIGARLLGPHYLPDPEAVAATMWAEARSGALAFNLGMTLTRVLAGFSLAMIAGSALGVALGRSPWLDRLLDPWVVILLNTPALVVIMFAYIWGGLNEVSALAAIALNKLPNAVITLREGARALDPALDEMAQVFAFSRWRRWRHVVAPQLAPFFAAAARGGLALVWKIVLVVELLGRPNGVGFKMNEAFQLFDLRLLLAYALPFIALMMLAETFVLRPAEKAASWWRRHGA